MNPIARIFFPIALIVTAVAALHAAAGRDIKTDIKPKTGVATCTQKGSQCAVTINAIGDVVTLDVKRMKAQDLGVINEEKTVTINLPRNRNLLSVSHSL
jgi:hypothetical protein